MTPRCPRCGGVVADAGRGIAPLSGLAVEAGYRICACSLADLRTRLDQAERERDEARQARHDLRGKLWDTMMCQLDGDDGADEHREAIIVRTASSLMDVFAREATTAQERDEARAHAYAAERDAVEAEARCAALTAERDGAREARAKAEADAAALREAAQGVLDDELADGGGYPMGGCLRRLQEALAPDAGAKLVEYLATEPARIAAAEMARDVAWVVALLTNNQRIAHVAATALGISYEAAATHVSSAATWGEDIAAAIRAARGENR